MSRPRLPSLPPFALRLGGFRFHDYLSELFRQAVASLVVVSAGSFLLLEDQYRVGDSVMLASTSGDVDEIRLRVTVFRDVPGNAHYIPNGEIRVATNMTRDYAPGGSGHNRRTDPPPRDFKERLRF